MSHVDGEELSADCVVVDIVAGDYKVPTQGVRTRILPGRAAGESVVRITTPGAVEEPVLTVTVSMGCINKTSRVVTLFADPPAVNLPESTLAAAPSSKPSQSPPPLGDLLAQAQPPARTDTPTSGLSATEPARKSAPRSAAKKPSRSSPPTLPSRASIVARPSRVTSPDKQAGVTPHPALPSSPSGAVATPLEDSSASLGRPALKLEAVAAETRASEAAGAEKAAAAALAALAAADAASAAQIRLKALEVELEKLRLQAQQQAQQFSVVQAQLARAQTAAQPDFAWLLPLLGGAAAVLGLTSFWLWQRDRRLRRQYADWWDAQSNPAVLAPAVAAEATPPRDFSPSRTEVFGRPTRSDSSTLDALHSVSPPERSIDTPAPSQGLDSMMSPQTVQGAPRPSSAFAPLQPSSQNFDSAELSVDEQIDIEQQADFFIALGHDDEAVDLLMANLRSTGGSSPLPYLKLLEIHRRLGQREEYERTRTRFNQRFNSVAPDWSTDPSTGRLLDQYPLVMGRIQAAWTSPLDAMVELESLLFGRSDYHEVFELPAYQEVLLLYQVAREMHTSQPKADATEDVDVLLPIGGPVETMTSDGTIVLRPEFNAGRPMTLDLELESLPAALSNDVRVTGSAPSIARQDQQRRDDS